VFKPRPMMKLGNDYVPEPRRTSTPRDTAMAD